MNNAFKIHVRQKAENFHAKSTWQPPVRNSVALKNYLGETKLEIASAIFRPQIDNISAKERNAIRALKRNSRINLNKADKGTTMVILKTAHKIDEGLQQLSNVDSLLQLVAIKQESYIIDTNNFIDFTENTQIPDNVVLATLHVRSLNTNIPQEEGIDVVCR